MQFLRRWQLEDSRFKFLIRRDSREREERERKRKNILLAVQKMRSNAQQWRNAMRYWKCIRYPISREFIASGYAVVLYRDAARSGCKEFHFCQIEIRSPKHGRRGPRRDRCTLRLRSTTPDVIPLPVIWSCWNIACYTNDRVPISRETWFIKTDDWFVRLVSPRKWCEYVWDVW